jgi:hypothetical protein
MTSDLVILLQSKGNTMAKNNSIIDDNDVEVFSGHRVSWSDHKGSHVGNVEHDHKFSDNLRIGGQSVRSIWEESDSFEVV